MIFSAKTGPAMTFDGVRSERSYLDHVKRKGGGDKLTGTGTARARARKSETSSPYSTYSVFGCLLLPTSSHIIPLFRQAA